MTRLPDMALWLADTIRGLMSDGTLPALASARVVETMPHGYDGEEPLVWIRDDGASPRDMGLTQSSSLAVTVWAGLLDANTDDAWAFAAALYDALTDIAIACRAGSPVCAVDGATSPVRVSDDHLAGYYMTVDYTIVNTIVNGNATNA